MKPSPAKASQSGTFLLGGKLPIHRLGFGAMRLTGPNIWGDPPNRKEAHAILRRAIDLGINLIDTADSYGPEISENIIAEALHPYPSDLVIATKGGLVRPGPDRWVPIGRPEYLIQCVEMSLRRLKMDCIPLYQLHAIDSKVPLEDSLGALKQMQKQGKIRDIGLSNFSVPELEKAKKVIDFVSVQNHYNLTNRESEPVLHYCEQHSLGFIPWYPIASGQLAQAGGPLQQLAKRKGCTTAQLSLAWLLKHSKVMLPIPGTAQMVHLEENIASAALDLTDDEYALLNQAAEG
ncbi:MAG: aldo/keto reductase [Parachlamydia sp.]|nr:aldo/keto reductase [Parachlamydia sp.]